MSDSAGRSPGGTNVTSPNEVTLDAERAEADADHRADREPTAEEEASAEEARQALGDEVREVAAHADEMNRLGANQTGEGRVP